MRDLRNILIIRPSALGDVCRTVPVLAGLRRAYPEARIDWLVQKEFADAIWHHPALSEPVLFDRRGIGQALKRGRLGPLFAHLGRLRRAEYDAVIDAQGLARSGFFAWVTGARFRVGYASPEAREGAWIWYTRRVRVDDEAHTVEKMMALAEAVGSDATLTSADMRLFTGPVERAWAREAIGSDCPYVVLAPTSRWPGKRWPADRFATVAEVLIAEGLDIAVVGGGAERDQCGPLLSGAAGGEGARRIIDLVGKTSVGQLMAVIQGAALVVANDSAALHMAVGLGRPLVGLYGPTKIGRVGPFWHEEDVIQHVAEGDVLNHKDESAGRAMMDRIQVEEVVRACRERIQVGQAET